MTAELPDLSGDDSISEHSVEDHCIYMESDRPAGVSPLWPESQTRESVSPGQDPVSEGPGSSAQRHGIADDEDMHFHYGMQAGDTWPKAGVSLDVDQVSTPGRPKAAAKMLVRSGLRCPRYFLKTWVCLCDRAPIEVDRRGTALNPSVRYWLFCLPSARVRRHQWRAAVPVRSAIESPAILYQRSTSPYVPYYRSIIWQLFMRYNYCIYPPRPRRTQMQPNRGPKSAPEPFYERPAPLATHRLRGVRVSPLSAGGEGLCKARSRLLKRPGKLAEGIRQQLGSLSCHVSTGSGHHHHTLSRHVPWGKRFRLWRFRYKIVRFKKRRSRKLRTGTASNSHTPPYAVTAPL